MKRFLFLLLSLFLFSCTLESGDIVNSDQNMLIISSRGTVCYKYPIEECWWVLRPSGAPKRICTKNQYYTVCYPTSELTP